MDPYFVLGLQRNATEDEAKAAFRKLAKTCHPDLHPNDPDAEKRFKEINAAYEMICKGETATEPLFRQTNFRFEDIFGGTDFDNIFSELRARQRNMDMHLECRITLEDVFQGKELDIHVPVVRGTPRTVKVKIPAGIMDGWRICIQRGGSQGNPAMPPGDLYLIVRILPHSVFTREGNNIVTTVPVTAFDVLLGKEIEVAGIEGKTFNVNIPSGFDSMRKLRLAGQGIPDPHTHTRGDLLIDLFVMYPDLNDEQRALIEKAVNLSKVTA